MDDDLADLPTADYTTIQAAINASADGDEIVVYPGVYADDLDMNNRLVTLRSTDPDDPAVVAATVITPGASTNWIIRCNGAETSATVIDGFTLNTGAENAPVLVTAGAGLTIRRCVYRGYGGRNLFAAIEIDGGSGVLIDRCTFDDLRPGPSGFWTAFVRDSTGVAFVECSWTDCRITPVFIDGNADVTFDACTFDGNRAANAGSSYPGAVFILDDSNEVTFRDCTFSENRASKFPGGSSTAGAIRCASTPSLGRSDLVLLRCGFYANEAAGDSSAGGGAVRGYEADIEMTDCVFVGNEVVCQPGGIAYGGAVAVEDSSLAITGCTFHANRATSLGLITNAEGGAVHASTFNTPTSPTFANSIFRNNTLSNGVSTAVEHYNFTIPSSWNLTSGNPRYVSDPNNGGDGWGDDPATGAVDEGANDDYGDLRLKPNSPAVGAGSNTFVISSTDFEGRPRIIGTIVDQGAYESGYSHTGAYYVDAGATGSGEGDTWGDAAVGFDSLFALPIAGPVHVAEGTYPMGPAGLELMGDIEIFGGYQAGGASRNPNTFVTVLNGDVLGDDQPGGVNRTDNAPAVLFATGAADITIDGLTVSGGNAPEAGGGLRLESCTGVLLNDVVIADNDSEDRAAGLLANATDLTITDSEFSNNRAARVGAMRVIGASVATVSDTDFIANTADENVGAVTVAEASVADFTRCLFADNQAGDDIGALLVGNEGTLGSVDACVFRGNSAGGLVGAVRYSGDGSGTISNSLFRDNTTGNGGGTVRLQNEGTLDVINTTIVDNHATSGSIAGVAQAGTSVLTLTSSIVHGNTAPNAPSVQDAQIQGAPIVNYTLVEEWDGSFAGTGSIDGDPKFVNAANDNFRLGAASDAIDAGDSNAAIGTVDLANQARLADDTGTLDTGIGGPPVVDMGAYEFQGTTPPCEADCDGSGTVNIDDIDCFVVGFLSGDLDTADCDSSGVLNIDDIDCFVAVFLDGCP